MVPTVVRVVGSGWIGLDWIDDGHVWVTIKLLILCRVCVCVFVRWLDRWIECIPNPRGGLLSQTPTFPRSRTRALCDVRVAV